MVRVVILKIGDTLASKVSDMVVVRNGGYGGIFVQVKDLSILKGECSRMYVNGVFLDEFVALVQSGRKGRNATRHIVEVYRVRGRIRESSRFRVRLGNRRCVYRRCGETHLELFGREANLNLQERSGE